MRSSRIVLASVLLASFATLACDPGRLTELEAELEQERELARAAQDDAVATVKAEADAASARAKAELEVQQAEVETLTSELEDAEAKIKTLESSKGKLEDTLAQKEAALAAVKTLQDALAKSLVEEIETGDVRVSERDGLLVVDVSDTVLFGIGEAELSEGGRALLDQLAKSLLALPKDSVFQVGGHTDNQPIKSEEVLAKFPTNWELSAARATNVVRYLEETAKVPGKRLVAAAFAQYRPIASNAKPKGRAKNRRIEIALLVPR